jgi:hypothetical protein
VDVLSWLRAEWDRVAGFGLIALGAIALVIGYQGVNDSPYVAEELAYIISGGLGGLFLLGTGATLLISADLHDEWRKLDRIEAAILGTLDEIDHEGVRGGGRGTSGNGETARGRVDRRRVKATLFAARPLLADSGGAVASPFRMTAAATVLGFVAAAIVMYIGWHRAANTDDPSPAIRHLAVAVAGLIVASTVAMGGTLRIKRSARLRRSRLLDAILLAQLPRRAELQGQEAAAAATAADVGAKEVLVAPGLTRYHRPGCPAIEGLAAKTVTRAAANRRLDPCGICHET